MSAYAPPTLSTAELEASAEVQHAELLKRAGNAANIVATLWEMAMKDLSDESADQFVLMAASALDDVCEQVARSEVGWLEAIENIPPGTTAIDYQALVAGLRGGVSSADLMRRAVIAARSDRGSGVSLTDALLTGMERARNYAQTNTSFAHRAAAQSYVRNQKQTTIRHWRRKPNPGACLFCLTAAQQRYNRDDLLPMHPKCLCMTVPILDGQKAPRDFLSKTQQAQLAMAEAEADAGKAEHLVVKTVYTKELGPTLVSKNTQGPTGPVSASPPSAKGPWEAKHPPVEEGESADVAPGFRTAMKDGGAALKALKLATTAPGMRHLVPFDKDDPSHLNAWHKPMVDEFADRLVELYNRVPQEIKDKAKNWYRVAHGLGRKWADQYEVHPDTVYGVIAVTSPGTDWNHNLTQAEAIIRTFQDRERTITQGDIDLWNNKLRLKAEQGGGKKKAKDLPPVPQWIYGLSLRELADRSPHLAAMMVRPMANRDDNTDGLPLRLRDEKGEFVRTKGSKGQPGRPQSTRWQSVDNLEKAIRILQDPSYQSVSHQLGHGHKIRSFYNNMRTPGDDYHVTVDTHAIGILFRVPWTVSSKWMNKLMSQPKSVKNDMTGVYWIAADGYRAAAERMGILPNEMQAIVWEYWRMLWPKSARNDTVIATVENIWKSVDSGAITAQQGGDLVEELRLLMPGALGGKGKGVKIKDSAAGLPPHLQGFHPLNFKPTAEEVAAAEAKSLAKSKAEAAKERVHTDFNRPLEDRLLIRSEHDRLAFAMFQKKGKSDGVRMGELANAEKKKFKLNRRELTNAMIDSVYVYQGAGFFDMNRSLRRPMAWRDGIEKLASVELDQARARERYVQKMCGLLQKAIEKSEVTKAATVYRGISGHDSTERLSKLYVPGRIFRDPGFTSTSLDGRVAKGFSRGHMLLKIVLPEGHPALRTNAVEGGLASSEMEVVLPANTRYRVVSLETEDEATLVTLEVLPWQYLEPGGAIAEDEILEKL